MLRAIVLRLRQADESPLPTAQALLSWWRQFWADDDFTLALLDDGQPYMRITAMSSTLNAELDALLNPVLLHNEPFPGWQLSELLENHPDAGCTNYVSMMTLMLKLRPPHKAISFPLYFVSPTYFKDSPLPDVYTLFSELQARWEYFSGAPFPQPLDEFFVRHIEIIRHNISGDVRGFVGSLHFRIHPPRHSSEHVRREWQYGQQMTRALTNFAFYAGIGEGVQRGSGQVRLHRPDHAHTTRSLASDSTE
jgi:hypothetical protein